MKNVIGLAAILLAVAAPPVLAQKSSPADLVKQAVAAEGGADKLRALKRLSITAEETLWEPEQSMVADGPPRPLGRSNISIRWDLEHGMERADIDHTILYFLAGQEKYSEIVTPAMGAVVTDKGQRAMSGARLAFDLRELERASPLLLLSAMDQPKNVSAMPDQKLGKASLPAVAFADGGTKFIILFDRKSHLPAAIRTLEDDLVHGDGHYDMALAEWKDVGGVKIAHSLHYTFNGLDKLKVTYTQASANPALPGDSFAIDDAVKQAAKGPRSGDLPWQEILGQQSFGRFDDLQAEKNEQAGMVMKLNELSPNIQHARGRSHNSLIVAMPTYLVVFDSPLSEAQSRWTIDAAKAKYPGKPVKYLVLTHHHMDHIGGMRTYVAEGATIIVGKPDKAHIQRVAAAPHTMHPDELQKHPRHASVVEVGDRMALKDGGREIDIFRIANPHAEGMLIGFVKPEKLVWVTDLYSPGQKVKTDQAAEFYATVKKLGIAPEWYAGGHGGSGKQADFDALMATK
ncbi:MAG TPA: MBL fold metallo-hydrolase [Stellaceae bacterium]|nr:MBL fold metallo-hydrolase [Stellaceae bacterium]